MGGERERESTALSYFLAQWSTDRFYLFLMDSGPVRDLDVFRRLVFFLLLSFCLFL